MSDASPNQVVCPACGEVRMETPPGTTALPTLGMARKAAGAGPCDCGRAAHEPPEGVSRRPGSPRESGSVSQPDA